METKEHTNEQQSADDQTTADSDEPKKLTEVLDHVVEETEEKDEVNLETILDSFGSRSHGPLLLIPALLALIPIVGGIPGMSIVTGSIIILISAQMLIWSSRPWLPRKLLDFSFSQEKLDKTAEKTKSWVKPFERLIHRRLQFMFEGPMFYLIPIVCIGLGLLFYPAALLPWAVAIPSFAVFLIALGLTSEDGLLILLGYVITGVSIWLAIRYWPF